MNNRVPLIQALDEREQLMRKLRKRIELASLADLLGYNKEKLWNKRAGQKRFEKSAGEIFQQIRELVERYQEMNEVIEASYEPEVVSVSGSECTAAYAFALRDGSDSSITGEAFGRYMREKMRRDYYSRILELERRSAFSER